MRKVADMVLMAALAAFALIGHGETEVAIESQTDGLVLGKECLNSPIDFCFPYLGDMDESRVLDFSIGERFSNGVVTVVLNGSTNTWTILGIDRPMYKFGRYYCGFVREDRPDGGHSLYMTLFYDGEMIGAEKLRGAHLGTNLHAELDDIPEGIEQVGGGRWEAGFLLFHGVGPKWVDVNQMMFRHRENDMLPFELRNWLRKATDDDIRKEWSAIESVIKAFYEMPSETNSDDGHIFGAAEKLKSQFFNALKYWKVHNAKTTNAKYGIIRAESDIEGIGKKCDAARRGGRGSHAWGDWGECLYNDLLMAWILVGEDAECWNAVANMKGRIDQHELEFVQGFATADLTLTKEEDEDGKEPLILYKVQHDFYRDGEYVYAKVMGDEPSYCYMPVSYQPPTYVVKVDKTGKIVRWFNYPPRVKSLKELLGGKRNSKDVNDGAGE